MAAPGISKAQYLQRYLSGPPAAQPRRRRKKKPPSGSGRAGMRIVDDDVGWSSIAAVPEKEEEEDESDVPVVAEFIDERPNEVKLMEEFRTNTKWKLLGDQNEDSQSSDISAPAKPTTRQQRHDSPDLSPPRQERNDSPKLLPCKQRQGDSPDLSPPRRKRHDSPDLSPPRRKRHDSPDLSPPRRKRHDSPDLSPPRRKRHDSPDPSPPKRQRHDSPDLSPERVSSAMGKKGCQMTDASRVEKLRRDSDSPPPRRGTQNASEADLSPQRKNHRALPSGKGQRGSRSPPDLSRHRYPDDKGSPKKAKMMSGVKAGLVSADVLRKEQQELRKQERSSKHLEEESRHTETIFRDKSGRKRDLEQERLEQKQKDAAKSERDEQYARWGKGLAQGRQQQQNVEDAIKEMQKPLARYIDDEDLDRMLREQEREGDPMAEFIKKRKAKENKEKEKPKYSGPAPPLNRFNIWPGHRWDGVDRSNGFEKQFFARMADKKAVQELAYKWSIEDM
ncbi:BUD13 homolog isoform X2 [Centrocercus urophasianus]|uniref:BUD13 homolog isoform X2 n=1 Tax=Centrocercus urophasianus TaxID=9002 RepID=UPI001C647992|nr:BUD13 homolog isoform X2 [Centrocercus urophasianus]